jgi:hypothetical protein
VLQESGSCRAVLLPKFSAYCTCTSHTSTITRSALFSRKQVILKSGTEVPNCAYCDQAERWQSARGPKGMYCKARESCSNPDDFSPLIYFSERSSRLPCMLFRWSGKYLPYFNTSLDCGRYILDGWARGTPLYINQNALSPDCRHCSEFTSCWP